MTTDIKAAVLRNELAIIIGCLDGRSAHEKAESVIAWMDKYDQRASIQPVAAQGPTLQAHVMPPFAAPAGQHDAGASVLTPERIVELFRQNVGNAWNNETFNCVGFARAIEAEFASRFRAQGGNTSPESNPATPAQAATDEVRDVAEWISVEDRLPEVGQLVMVFSPPTKHDYPGEVSITFDCIDPDADEPTSWLNHNEHYEYYCCVGKPEGSVGPSAEAPYTHWMPMPDAPRTTSTTTQAATVEAKP